MVASDRTLLQGRAISGALRSLPAGRGISLAGAQVEFPRSEYGTVAAIVRASGRAGMGVATFDGQIHVAPPDVARALENG